MEYVHEKQKHKSDLPHVDVVYEAASLEMFLRLLTDELSVGCTFEHGMPIVSICLWLVQFLGGLIQRQTLSGKKGLLSDKSTFHENALEEKKKTKNPTTKQKSSPSPPNSKTKPIHNQPLVPTERKSLQMKRRLFKTCMQFSWSGPTAFIYISSLYDMVLLI